MEMQQCVLYVILSLTCLSTLQKYLVLYKNILWRMSVAVNNKANSGLYTKFAVYFSEFNQIWSAQCQIGLSQKSCEWESQWCMRTNGRT